MTILDVLGQKPRVVQMTVNYIEDAFSFTVHINGFYLDTYIDRNYNFEQFSLLDAGYKRKDFLEYSKPNKEKVLEYTYVLEN